MLMSCQLQPENLSPNTTLSIPPPKVVFGARMFGPRRNVGINPGFAAHQLQPWSSLQLLSTSVFHQLFLATSESLPETHCVLTDNSSDKYYPLK